MDMDTYIHINKPPEAMPPPPQKKPQSATKPAPMTTSQPQKFEPKCDWVHEDDGSEILHVHVPGFKRDNLKVQVTTSGNLWVLGDRKINDKQSVQFHKEFSLPENCDVGGITAKFEREVLRVRLPKKPAMRKEEEVKQETKHTASAEEHDKASSQTQDQWVQGQGGGKATKEVESSKQNEKTEGLSADKPVTQDKYQKMHPRNLMPKKTTILAVLILAIAIALGALRMSMPKKTTILDVLILAIAIALGALRMLRSKGPIHQDLNER